MTSGRRGVDRDDPAEDRDGNDQREDDLRQEASEVRLERLDPLDGDRGDLGALGTVERLRLMPKTSLDELEPKLREDADGAAPSRELERPRQHPTRAEDQHEQNEVARDVVERRAVERARDDASEKRRLEEDEDCGRNARRQRRPPSRRAQREHGAGGADRALAEASGVRTKARTREPSRSTRTADMQRRSG